MEIQRLRSETAADHDAVEGSVPLMSDALTAEEYVSSLRAMYGMVAAWEDLLDRSAPAWVLALLTTRRRKHLLARDLAHFGAALPAESGPALPVFPGDAGLLGAMYVMEGSTLGGQFIARHVERVLGLVPGEGNAYFRGHAERTGTLWKEFLEVLRTAVPDSETGTAVVAAKAMFGSFGEWMRLHAQPAPAAVRGGDVPA